jgi:SAM-dependent methyltransferase
MLWYNWLFWAVWIVGVLLVIAYAAVMPFGAIYLPTIKTQRQKALDLLNLKPGQTFVDLGSGDGSMLILAAERGLKAVGYELNPFLVVFTWLRTRRYGRRVKVRQGNFWHADISDADGVFVFLITHHMKHLDRFMKRQAEHKPIRIVSNSFEIPGKKALKHSGTMLLYEYRPVDKPS